MIEVTTREQFEDIIVENDKVLVDIYTDYCSPCKKMKADVLPKIDGEITIVMINGSVLNKVAPGLPPVMAVPTFFLLKEGVPVNQCVGGMTEAELRKFADIGEE